MVFLEHNKLFQERGWQVVPFSMMHENNISSEWSKYFVDEIELGKKTSAFKRMLQAGKIVYSFEARRKITQLVKKVRPSVCHVHNIYHHISPSILSVMKAEEIPLFMTLHDLKLACPAYKMLSNNVLCEKCKNGKIYNLVANRCMKTSVTLSSLIFVETLVHRALGVYKNNVDCFVVPSRFYLEKFVEWGWDRSRFQYLPNFVKTESYEADFTAGEYYVYFGRLSEEKGLPTLINAAKEANIQLVIVGAGPEEQRLKKLATGIGAQVVFSGYQTGDNLKRIIQKAKAVVIPSEWYENAPISLLEAYALGKPVIGANIGGIPELVKENETGFIFSAGSTTELTSAMARLESLSASDIAQMGRTARKWVESEFGSVNYIERMTELYSRYQ